MSKVIEFLGMSRSGKTTQVRMLVEALSASGYSCRVVRRPDESCGESRTPEEWHRFMYEDLCAAHEAYSRDPTDFLLYDRGFYDRLALLAVDSADGHITGAFRNELTRAIKPRLAHIDFALVFSLHPELSLQRWSRQRAEGLDKSDLCSGLDTRDSLDGLKCMAQIYRTTRERFASPKWYEIDGAVTIEETHAEIMDILGLRLPYGLSSSVA